VNYTLTGQCRNDSYKKSIPKRLSSRLAKEFRPRNHHLHVNGGSDPHVQRRPTSLGLTLDGFKMIGRKVGKCPEICAETEITWWLRLSPRHITLCPWMALIAGWATLTSRWKKPSPSPTFAAHRQPDAGNPPNMIAEVEGLSQRLLACCFR